MKPILLSAAKPLKTVSKEPAAANAGRTDRISVAETACPKSRAGGRSMAGGTVRRASYLLSIQASLRTYANGLYRSTSRPAIAKNGSNIEMKAPSPRAASLGSKSFSNQTTRSRSTCWKPATFPETKRCGGATGGRCKRQLVSQSRIIGLPLPRVARPTLARRR